MPEVQKIVFSLVCLISIWLLAEIVFYAALRAGVRTRFEPHYDYVAWTNPRFMVADAGIGFRLKPGETNDGLRITRGEVQSYYRGIIGNAAGFHSDHEFWPRKQRPYRIVVYGDSFSAMMYVRRPWPDHLHTLLEPAGIEVYNFSFEAGGLANWSAHYFTELLDGYEFDLVVFAVCCDDMARTFSMWETREDGAYFGRFTAPPADQAAFHSYRRQLVRLAMMTSPDWLRELNEHFTNRSRRLTLPLDFYLARAITSRVGARLTEPRSPPLPLLSGASQRQLFLTLLRDIRRRGKTAVVVTLPWAGADSILREWAREGCTPFFDGGELVLPKTAADFPRLKYDGHWLQPAADYFAEKLAPELLSLRDRTQDSDCSTVTAGEPARFE